ncbi:T-complex-associated testis-expressed protein [Schistosoma japonicum]|uniref:T-complex-associated testis-expressed protein n=1 Tax=Schistosoma japonicum TaxID=6182 RepID=A0A4Z2DFG1_SCHJA|nr:T-complex-associated testis-expressed protein [Schistosoma japonicum]
MTDYEENTNSQLPEKTELENNETVINIEPITSPDGLLNKTQNVIPLLNESPLDNLKTAQTKEKLDKFTTDCRIMRRIIAEDSNYNLTIIPTLVDLCIKHCIENFEFNPTPIMFVNEKQKSQIINSLPTNLSLKVTSHLINDELYWKRCCHAKWSIIDVSYYDDSWKRAYFERYLQEIIETFIPGTTSIQRLNECVNYAAPYIQCLHIQQLLPPLKQMNKEKNTIDNDSISDSESDQLTVPNDMHHLDLTLILSKLTHLHELTLMYQVKQCGMNFDWSLFQFTMNDCLNLSKALQLYQQQLKVLNLVNSHVNSEQCRLLAIHLQNHSTLNCLNLSHNSIGYRGIRALSKLLTGNNRITSLNLTNNRLKSSSGLSIAYALTQSTCSLVQLNLCMNKLQDEGGIAIAKALVQNSTLKELNLSVNDLHENTASYFGHVLTRNNTLTHLDLSNNQIGVAGSKKLQDGMDQNSCLIHLDLRFTGSSQEAEYAISQRIEMNQTRIRKLQQEVPNVQQSTPSEITSVARRQRPLIEYPSEVSFAALEV